MIAVRALVAVAMVVVGATILVKTLPFGLSGGITGIVLGAAMIALGLYRLRQIRAVWGQR